MESHSSIPYLSLIFLSMGFRALVMSSNQRLWSLGTVKQISYSNDNKVSREINNNKIWFLKSALYTMSQSASNITTLITGPFHSLSHLSSLWSIQPVPPNMYHTKAISTLTGTYLPLGGVLLRDTGVTTRIRTHTLLNRNTRA